MQDTLAAIIYNEPVGASHFRLGLKTGWKDFVPGQFVMLEAASSGVFLRRPFGIVAINNGVLEICVRIKGRATHALSKKKEGEAVRVLGPLGRGWLPLKEFSHAILVAGGYGIAPLLPLARYLKSADKGHQPHAVNLYYGAKDASRILYLNEMREMNLNLTITTEDGSRGEKGLITERLQRDLQNSSMIFACGPHGLLRELAMIAATRGAVMKVSLEQYMACGLGVCLGCMIKMKDGSNQRVCREGPVFDAGSILWE